MLDHLLTATGPYHCNGICEKTKETVVDYDDKQVWKIVLAYWKHLKPAATWKAEDSSKILLYVLKEGY